MKKLLVILLAIIAVFTLVACGQKEDIKYGPEHDEQIIGGVQTPNPWIELSSYEEALAKNVLAPDLSQYGCNVKSYLYDENSDMLDINAEGFSLRIAKDDGLSSVRELSGCYYDFIDDNGIYFMMDKVFQRMVAKSENKNIYLHWFEEDGYYFILTSECEGDFVSPFN